MKSIRPIKAEYYHYGDKEENFNFKATDESNNKIMCRHIASYAYLTSIDKAAENLFTLNNLTKIPYLNKNIYDKSLFDRKLKYIITDSNQLSTAFKQLTDSNVQKTFLLTAYHAMCVELLKNKSSIDLKFYDPNHTNAVLEITGPETKWNDITNALVSHPKGLKSYLDEVQSITLTTTKASPIPSPRIECLLTQQPAEALGWCVRQNDMQGAANTLAQLKNTQWAVTSQQAHFLGLTFQHLDSSLQLMLIRLISNTLTNDNNKIRVITAFNNGAYVK